MDKKLPLSKSVKRRIADSDSFLEALRDLGSGVVDSAVHDVAGGIASEAFNQITGRQTGELKPNQPVDLTKKYPEFLQKEEQLERRFQRQFSEIRQQERLVYKQTEQETQLKIRAILAELQKLAESTKNLAKEVEIASAQIPVEPGTYHLSFFERLRQTIILFRKRIEESATWLMAVNQKAKKRNYYWAQVRKSGTKFLLSQERYMATQAG